MSVSQPAIATLTLAQDMDAVHQLAHQWTALLQQTPCHQTFSAYEWYCCAQLLVGSALPRVYCLWHGPKLVALLPLVLDAHGQASFAGKMSDFSDLIVADQDLNHGRSLLDAVLADPEIKRLSLSELRFDSQLVKLMDPQQQARLSSPTACPYLTLPTGLDSWLASLTPKKRKLLRDTWRTASRAGIQFRELRHGDWDPTDFAQTFVALHQQRFQERSCFGKEPGKSFVLALIPTLWQRRLLRPFALLQGGHLKGMQLCMVSKQSLGNWNGCFDAEINAYSPGRLLIASVIRQALEEGMAEYDFLRGDEPYKFKWTGQVRNIYNLEPLP